MIQQLSPCPPLTPDAQRLDQRNELFSGLCKGIGRWTAAILAVFNDTFCDQQLQTL